MSVKPWATWLLAGGLLATTAVYAQSIREHQSESTAPSTARKHQPEKGPDLARVEQLILEGTNRFRRENGRGQLHLNAKLTRAAREFAEYLASTNKFSHTADGKEPWDRTAAQGYDGCIVAENIAWEYNSAGFSTRRLATALVEGWEKSPPHRKNLLDPDLEEIGVGVAYSDSTARYYAVQDFGRPKAEQIAFAVSNGTGQAVQYTVDGKDFSVQPRYTYTFERCRPPAVTFRGTGPAGKDQVVHPHNGAHYFLEGAGNGRYTVQEE